MEAQGHDGNAMVSGCHLGFGSSSGGKVAAAGSITGKHFWHQGPYTSHVMKAVGDQPMGLAIYTLF